MCAKLIPLSQCALVESPVRAVSFYKGQEIKSNHFCSEVSDNVQRLKYSLDYNYALYYEEAYPFTVMLFALLHAGKKVWLASNNCLATAEKLQQQDCVLLGDWQGKESLLEKKDVQRPYFLSKLDLDASHVIIFTSGSSGQPKAIKKNLWQFQNEIDVLEKKWGNKLGQAHALATVSHQHIYGLLFRVLWPLATGRCSHSTLYLSPESMFKSMIAKPAYWIASPAQQKRLNESTPWHKIAKLKVIFSSGGCLNTEVSKQIYHHSQQRVIEVYGSSETGGIAWREAISNENWTLFEGINIKVMSNRFLITSPYIPDNIPSFLEDKIELSPNRQFKLRGRMDRIVKVEEKRLSLDEMEQVLCQHEWVEQTHCLLWVDKRDLIASVVILSPLGLLFLKEHGKRRLTQTLRNQLMQHFEGVVLPRKWLLMNDLPLTTQGKIDHDKISSLLSLNSQKFPQLQFCQYDTESVILQLRIQAELIYFQGHFPKQPILAGVTQLAWVERYGKLFFNIEPPFLRMEVIKFKKIIRPDDIITMHLSWNIETGKLYFDLSSDSNLHSSGRMLYGDNK